MSFAAQERALFDLLFDRTRRARFRDDPVAALSAYDLTAEERADFSVLRADALELDAGMRTGLILAQFCRGLPLSFSLVSSLPEGLQRLRALIDVETMRTPPLERLTAFGVRLRDGLRADTAAFASARDQALVLSVVEAELGMVWTACARKQAWLEAGRAAALVAPVPADWPQRPLVMADFVSAALLPQPYAVLKEALCPCTGAALWRHLGKEPFTEARRLALFRQPSLRLLVARAELVTPSRCEPQTEHVTVELPEGFARLLPHLDGTTPVSAVLAQLQAAGAQASVLDGVQGGFLQLLQNGMATIPSA
ncbi:MAG: hypothetical protein Q8J78_13435 [Moraxellaceae bacterium]|nr:hypothetical protein [Moraxellaceae bacterium]